MATYPSGSLVGPGLYYDLDEGRFARLPLGGELTGSTHSLYVALPTWAAPPLAAFAAVGFRFLFPLVLLAVVGFALLWRAAMGLLWLWHSSLHFIRLYPEPGLSYLTPRGRVRQSGPRRAGRRLPREARRGDGLIDLKQEIERRRQRDN
ncbi:MAG: hypothetical protein ACYC4L_09340 [Chloroflexota bacterium]